MSNPNDAISETEFSYTPPDVAEAANAATLELLPKKSRKQYEIVYARFQEWMKKKEVTNNSENILLAYFYEKSKTVKSSTLWSEYSMLKATLTVKNNIKINDYAKLIAFIKRQSVGYRPKKSKIFTSEQFCKFIKDAPNETFLFMKVVAIFGIAGACRRDELHKITTDDIEDNGSILIIQLPQTKTNKPRTFVVNGSSELNLLDYYRKYISYRPTHVESKKLFIRFSNGKCYNQVVGVNTFGKIPSDIGKYLCLPNPSQYTGHCFRRTSAILLADTGADILSLKRRGGWSSTSVAEGYVEEFIQNKAKVTEKIFYNKHSTEFPDELSVQKNTVKLVPSSSIPTSGPFESLSQENTIKFSSTPGPSQISIHNCNNCHINIQTHSATE